MNMFKKTGGFTLVELIVVIAILAILAGVAVPAYSGYIQNANKAADTQLLGAINTAFAAACAENGVDINTLTASTAVMPLASDKTVDLDNVKPENVAESFEKFFAGNEDSAFKVYEQIVFQDGAFVGYAADEVGGIFADIFNGLGEAIKDSVGKVTASGFGEIGAKELLNKVDKVTGLANKLMNEFENETLENALASTLVDLPGMLNMDGESEEFGTLMQEMILERAKQLNPENPDLAMNDARNEIASNFAVLYTAKNQMADIKNGVTTTDQLLTDLQSGMTSDDIIDLLKGTNDADTTREGITKTAMLYAMYTSYANNLPAGEDKNKALEAANNPTLFASALSNDTAFLTYLQNGDGQAEKDLEGYLGALDIINQSAQGNPDAVKDLLVNGYADPTLGNALEELLGK